MAQVLQTYVQGLKKPVQLLIFGTSVFVSIMGFGKMLNMMMIEDANEQSFADYKYLHRHETLRNSLEKLSYLLKLNRYPYESKLTPLLASTLDHLCEIEYQVHQNSNAISNAIYNWQHYTKQLNILFEIIVHQTFYISKIGIDTCQAIETIQQDLKDSSDNVRMHIRLLQTL